MYKDPIVDEIRRGREAHAKKFKFDLKAIFADLQKQQEESGLSYVTRASKGVAKKKSATRMGRIEAHRKNAGR